LKKSIITRIMSSIEIGEIGMILDSKRLEAGDFCTVDISTILGRKQPVVCNLTQVAGYDFRVLSMRTPLGEVGNVAALEERYGMYNFAYENNFHTVRLCYDEDAPDLYGVYMRVDLPVLPDDDNGNNSLSAYELNESLKALVECADMTERLVFHHQDIDLEAMSIDSRQLNKANDTLRKEISTVKLSGKWRLAWNKQYIQLFETLDKNIETQPKLWAMNHQMSFIKFLTAQQKTEASLSHLANDIQDKELKVLEGYFYECLKLEGVRVK